MEGYNTFTADYILIIFEIFNAITSILSYENCFKNIVIMYLSFEITDILILNEVCEKYKPSTKEKSWTIIHTAEPYDFWISIIISE